MTLRDGLVVRYGVKPYGPQYVCRHYVYRVPRVTSRSIIGNLVIPDFPRTPLWSGIMKPTPITPFLSHNNHPHPLRTLVVDDSVMFMEGLCAYLMTEPMFQVIGTALDGSEALHMVDILEPDLIFMDLHMPFMDGLQATEILRRRLPNMRIIMMTRELAVTAEPKSRAHGAHGFLRKLGITHGLIAEVRRAFRPRTHEGRAAPVSTMDNAEVALETMDVLR
jgi:CheY-like chemotaxis protein